MCVKRFVSDLRYLDEVPKKEFLQRFGFLHCDLTQHSTPRGEQLRLASCQLRHKKMRTHLHIVEQDTMHILLQRYLLVPWY